MVSTMHSSILCRDSGVVITEKSFVKENIQLRKEGNEEFELTPKLTSNLSYEKLFKQEIKDYTIKSVNYLYDFGKN